MVNEFEIKKQICDIGKRIYNRNMVAANDGNISVKLNDNEFLCTPTGVSKGFMTPEYICKVDAEGNVIQANAGFRPSSEIKMHMRVYAKRPDVGSVVHAHPVYATSFAIASNSIINRIVKLRFVGCKLEEEIRMSKLAAQSKWRDISEVSFEEGDRYLLANLIYCEAGNQPYEGQVAVGAVVINRVLSSVYPDTVVGVIYQNKQFSPVGSGRLALALAENRATDACYSAADAAMSGQTNVGTCVYFRTPIEGLSGIQIGGHIFY